MRTRGVCRLCGVAEGEGPLPLGGPLSLPQWGPCDLLIGGAEAARRAVRTPSAGAPSEGGGAGLCACTGLGSGAECRTGH